MTYNIKELKEMSIEDLKALRKEVVKNDTQERNALMIRIKKVIHEKERELNESKN